MSKISNIDINKQSVQDLLEEVSKENPKAVMCVYIDQDGLINCVGSNMPILEIFGAMDAAKMHIWEVSAD